MYSTGNYFFIGGILVINSCLTELQLANLYKKTKDSKYKNMLETKIDNLHKTDTKGEYTNEQLVLLIQKYNDARYWKLLYDRTKNTIHDVFHKEVKSFDKINKKEEVYSVLKTGWVKSVNKYDIYKATAEFHPFSSYLIHQEYILTMNKRFTKQKDGVSVKTIPLSTVHSNNAESDREDIASSNAAINLLEDEESTLDIHRLELQELLDLKLNVLKTYYPMSYEMIKEYYYNDKSQIEIAEEYNIQQTSVSRHIRVGKRFLELRFTKDEKEMIFNN